MSETLQLKAQEVSREARETIGGPVPPREQRLVWECECGRRISARLMHYEAGRCPHCRRVWWALQPKRKGPLIAFIWPGNFVTGALNGRIM